jgi:hypothetical protein
MRDEISGMVVSLRVAVVVLALASLCVGLLGLSEWLYGWMPGSNGSAVRDYGESSAWKSAVFMGTPLTAATITVLHGVFVKSGQRRSRLVGVPSLIYVVLVVLLVNSIGAWLFYSAMLVTLTWIVWKLLERSQRRRLPAGGLSPGTPAP